MKMNEVDVELAALQETVTEISANVEGSCVPAPAPPSGPPLVDKLLAYQVTNAATGEQFVAACYGVTKLSKEKLHDRTWEVVATLQRAGIAVTALVCDGASVNTAFYQAHPPTTATTSGTVFNTVNIYAPQTIIYFLTDAPHLLKTARNCLYQSGKRSKRKAKDGDKNTRDARTKKKHKEERGFVRNMKKNGQALEWKTVERLYNETKSNTIRTAFKLNQEDVYLTSYSVMRVSLAAHVLSRSFATEIRLRNWNECSELANYCEVMNDEFDMLNGKSAYQDVVTRNELLAPYSSPDDFRFHLLLEKWKFFEEWVDEIDALPPSVSATERAKRLISRQTLQNLERTILGFRGAVSHVLTLAASEDQTPKIIARNFLQDDLEHYFSKQRAKLGGNRHPDLDQALQSHVNIHQQKQLGVKGARKGNTAANYMPTVKDLSEEIKPRRPAKRSLLQQLDFAAKRKSDGKNQ